MAYIGHPDCDRIKALLKAFGLEDRNILKLTLTMEIDEPIIVEVKEFIRKDKIENITTEISQYYLTKKPK